MTKSLQCLPITTRIRLVLFSRTTRLCIPAACRNLLPDLRDWVLLTSHVWAPCPQSFILWQLDPLLTPSPFSIALASSKSRQYLEFVNWYFNASYFNFWSNYTGVQLLYNVVLLSSVRQSESLSVHLYLLRVAFLSIKVTRNLEKSSLLCTGGSC